MNTFLVLLARPFVEWKNSFKKNTLRDIPGMLLSIILIVALFYVYIKVGMAAISAYLDVRVNGVQDALAREHEAMTILYGVIMLMGVLSATRDLSRRLFENSDTKIYLTLPISSTAIFTSQMALVYLRQLLSTAVYVMSVNIMFAVLMHKDALFILSALLTSALLPLFTIAIASLVVFPYYFVKKVLGGRYIILLLLTTALVGVVFWGYSYILDLFSELIASGELRFFFSEQTMTSIAMWARYLYPANFYCNFNTGVHRVINFFIIFGISAVSILIGYFVCNKLFLSFVQGKFKGMVKAPHHLNVTAYTAPTFWSMIAKEFIMVLRTPSYAFQYFSVALTMPLMVALSMRVGVTFLDSLVAVNCNFELAILTTIIFSMLTNTFCASNISRDGSSFWLMKTYPLPPRLYVMSKVVFCFMISFVSITISCIVESASGYITAVDGLFVFMVGCILSFAQICFATRCDLDHPHFVGDGEDALDSDNATINMVILLGLLTALLVGGGMLMVKVWSALRNVALAPWISPLVLVLVSLVGLGMSLAILFVGMRRSYNRLTEGEV